VSWFSARTDFDMTTLLSSFWKISWKISNRRN
jgi:hypothetical protein